MNRVSAFLLAAVSIVAPARAQDPAIALDPPRVDLGRVWKGETRRFEVALRNPTDEDLVLLRVETPCGCTLPRLLTADGRTIVPRPDAQIPKGGILELPAGTAARVEVELETVGLHTGRQSKRLLFHTAPSLDGPRTVTALEVVFDVSAAVGTEPPTAAFGRVARGTERPLRLAVVPESSSGVKVSAVERAPTWIRVTPVDTQEGEIAAFEISILPSAPSGALAGTIRFGLVGEAPPHLDVPVTAYVEPPVRVLTDAANPGRLDFGVVEAGHARTETVRLVAAPTAPPFRVTDVRIQAARGFDSAWKVTPDQPAREVSVDVTVRPSGAFRILRGSVIVSTDLPGASTLRVPFQAWVVRPASSEENATHDGF